jgi:prevent-host-death family protein
VALSFWAGPTCDYLDSQEARTDSYSIADAKARLSEIIERVETGETVKITKRGKLVARIEPPDKPLKPIDIDT